MSQAKVIPVAGAYFTAMRYDRDGAQLILDLAGGHQHIYKNVSEAEAQQIIQDRDPAGKVAVVLGYHATVPGHVTKT